MRGGLGESGGGGGGCSGSVRDSSGGGLRKGSEAGEHGLAVERVVVVVFARCGGGSGERTGSRGGQRQGRGGGGFRVWFIPRREGVLAHGGRASGQGVLEGGLGGRRRVRRRRLLLLLRRRGMIRGGVRSRAAVAEIEDETDDGDEAEDGADEAVEGGSGDGVGGGGRAPGDHLGGGSR